VGWTTATVVTSTKNGPGLVSGVRGDGDGPDPGVTVVLADGRRLGADDVGDPAGTPVVYLHGSPDCRLARHPDDGVAAGLGIRLLAVDRPGWGSSDPLPEPSVGAFAVDLAALLDHLGIDRAGLLAWSAGAPYALGAAAVLGHRVTTLVTYGAMPPSPAMDDPAVREASGPRLAMGDAVRDAAAEPVALAELVAASAAMLVPPPPLDAALALEHVEESLGRRSLAEVRTVPGTLEALAASVRAVVATGARGLAADLAVQFLAPLDVELAVVTATTRFVHGDRDRLAGPAIGTWLAAQVPGATLDVRAGAGHHAIFALWSELLALAAGAS